MRLLAALLALTLGACASSGPSAGVSPPKLDPPATIYLEGDAPTWSSLADVRKAIGSKGKLSGSTLDLQGCAISGVRLKHPKNSQDEKSTPLRIKIPGFEIRNGTITDIPGGIVNSADGPAFRKLTFVRVGEDALSNTKDQCEEMEVSDCRFYNGAKGDKSLQLNDARDAIVRGNYFTGGITAIRLQESTAKARDVRVFLKDNTFEKVPTAVNVDGYTTVEASGNIYKAVGKKWVLGPHATTVEK